MHRGLRKTFKGRGFYLLGGTLCATVVVVVAACCVISLLTIGRATQQQGRAIDAAIAAFDLYQQQRSPLENSASDAAARLDSDGTLAKLAADQDDVALREQVARRLAAFERANAGDVQGAYVVLRDAQGQVSFVLGSSSAAQDARGTEERLAQLDLDDLMASGHPVTRLSVEGDTAWSVAGLPYLEQAGVVVFYQMPEVPNVDVLEPIADIAEMYFADERGSLYPVTTSMYADAVDVSAATQDSEPQGIFSLTHDGQPFREYFHKPGDEGLIFIFIVPDVAQAAWRQFTLTVVVATAALVALGCAVGLFLTRRIYEPITAIIAKLNPQGRDVRDEFQLIGLAIQAMEMRLTEQDKTVAEFHLMRLLRGRATLAQEGAGFFFADPAREVALAIVRNDEPADPGQNTQLTGLIQDYLRDRGREWALCEEGGFAFVVVDARGGGVVALAAGLVSHAREEGRLVSVFLSDVHAGSAKLTLCYTEAVGALEAGTRDRAFNEVVRYRKPEPAALGGRGAQAAGATAPGGRQRGTSAEGSREAQALGAAAARRRGPAPDAQQAGAPADGGRTAQAASPLGVGHEQAEPNVRRTRIVPTGGRQTEAANPSDSQQAQASAAASDGQTVAPYPQPPQFASDEPFPCPEPSRACDERTAADLLDYVRQNYRDPALTASLVAERFGMSRAGVSRAFAKAVPEGGFLGYLHGLRLDKAEELLGATHLSVAEVAEAAGYGSALTMSRAFKRYRGTTPGAFRRSCEEEPRNADDGKCEG